MEYRVEFNISAIVIVLFLLLISRIRNQVHSIRTKLVYIIMLYTVLAAVSDLAARNLIQIFPQIPLFIVSTANLLEIFFELNVAAAVFYYNYYLVHPYVHRKINYISGFLMPFYLCLVLLIVNLFYPVLYRMEGMERYDRNGIFLVYLVISLYFLAALLLVVCYREQMDRKQLLSTYFYLAICLCGRVIDLFYPEIPVNNFCLSLADAILMFNIQDMEEMREIETGVFNRGCFKEDVVCRNEENRPFCLLYLYFAGYDDYREILDLEQRKNCQKAVKEILGAVCREGIGYYLSDEVFAVLYEGGREEAAQKEAQVFLELMAARFPVNMDSGVAGHTVLMNCPEELETLEDILSVADFLVNQMKYYPVQQIPKEKIEIQKQNRKVQLGKRILEILQNNAYEICYQPIYDRKRKLIAGACASMRFASKEQAAEVENYGHLQGAMLLEDKLFEDVCEMIQKSDTISDGKEFIEVAFSDVQFMQGDFVEKILNTMKKHEVEPERIRLCITEPVLASMNGAIEKNLRELADAGISFSLVNYGKGQSNFDRLNHLSFDTVEFDDRLVSTDEFDSREKEIILNAQMEALHRFGKKIRVYIGENENPAAKQLSSDFIRGEAIPAEQFAAMLQKQTAIRAMHLL